MNTATVSTAGLHLPPAPQDTSVAHLREAIRCLTALHPGANVGRDAACFLAGVEVSESSLSHWAAFDAAPCR